MGAYVQKRWSCDYCHESSCKKIERISAHLKDCQKKKEYLEKKCEEDVLDMLKPSSRNSDISIPSILNISDVSAPMASPQLLIG